MASPCKSELSRFRMPRVTVGCVEDLKSFADVFSLPLPLIPTLACIAGCDYFTGGINGIGWKTIMRQYNTERDVESLVKSHPENVQLAIQRGRRAFEQHPIDSTRGFMAILSYDILI